MNTAQHSQLAGVFIVVTLLATLGLTQTTHAQLTKGSPDVLLLWQADSYTPPLYRGKALHPAEGVITIQALPYFISGGSRLSPSTLNFTWKQDSTVLGSQSGIGRDTLIVAGSVLGRPLDISVTASTANGSLEATRVTRIPVTTPLVHFYEDNPVLGIRFERALTGTFNLTDEEVAVEAFPYFFSTNNRFESLDYEWRVNNQRMQREQNPYITLRQSGTSGQSQLSVSVVHLFNILEQAGRSISVVF